ncbi:hypothetical protein [Lapillicoccus jejuensis]|uniref:Uncharacterized protein n=1 Tax=Lapillicoccus jejuensis TaxID=402171 RepID=A0A542DVZ4_9MICO|nr:hypothetical protein [Lapillicoccus jejuensis]TQJ07270.1 hypothetical protein FB458_0328 [Lapillicoccus jejuensis]
MNRFSTLAKLADSMLTTPSLPTWGSASAPVRPAPQQPAAGPVSIWGWGG